MVDLQMLANRSNQIEIEPCITTTGEDSSAD